MVHQLVSLVRATQDQTFYLDKEMMKIKKGQSFYIVNSYKFSPKLFKDAALNAGLKIEYLMIDSSGMILVLSKNGACEPGSLKLVA